MAFGGSEPMFSNKDGSEPMFPNKDGSEAMFSVQTRTVDTEKRSDPRGFYWNLCKYSSNCFNFHPEFKYKIFSVIKLQRFKQLQVIEE